MNTAVLYGFLTRSACVLASVLACSRGASAQIDPQKALVEQAGRTQQAVGAHFVVSFEGEPDQSTANLALESLDRAYWRIGAALGTYPADPIPLVLYTTQQFTDITRSPSWAAGAYDGTIRVPMRGALKNPSELDRVLAHEFTHALVRSLAASGVPTWLNEGLASALETTDVSWAERRVRKAGHLMPLATLQRGFGRLAQSDAELAYATSALAVHQLLEDAGGYAVANLLRDLGGGTDFDAAFLHRFQRTFAQFASAFPKSEPRALKR
jgi:hypothetical protein